MHLYYRYCNLGLVRHSSYDNEQLLNEAELDAKNYADRGGCYPPRLRAEVDKIFRDLHNFSHHTTVEFSNSVLLFIQNIFQFLTSLLPWLPVDFLLNFGLFFVTVLGYRHRFAFLQILLKK